MTRDDAVDAIMRRLANRTDTSNSLRNMIIAEMVMVIEENLEREPELPWFLLEEITNIVTVADQEYLDLDADLLMLWDEDGGGFWRQNSDGTETQLKIDDWDIVKAKFNADTEAAATSTNAPTHGSVIANTLYMRPWWKY